MDLKRADFGNQLFLQLKSSTKRPQDYLKEMPALPDFNLEVSDCSNILMRVLLVVFP